VPELFEDGIGNPFRKCFQPALTVSVPPAADCQANAITCACVPFKTSGVRAGPGSIAPRINR
jgi:hypothetical protein